MDFGNLKYALIDYANHVWVGISIGQMIQTLRTPRTVTANTPVLSKRVFKEYSLGHHLILVIKHLLRTSEQGKAPLNP